MADCPVAMRDKTAACALVGDRCYVLVSLLASMLRLSTYEPIDIR